MLKEIAVRLVRREQEPRYLELMQARHYIGALPKIGETLWYVASWRVCPAPAIMLSSVCPSVTEHGVAHRSGPVIEHCPSVADQMNAQLVLDTAILAMMGKRRDKHPLEDALLAESSEQFMAAFSEQDERILEEIDVVTSFLTKADVDARRRKIIWEDGQRLSITQSARRIHAAHPDLSLEQIEDTVIGWLEMEFAPETYSEEQLDELDSLTEKWVDNHQAAREKRRRTPDS